MNIDEILTEIRSIKERLPSINPYTMEFAELTIALVELQNSIIYKLQSELEEKEAA
jgi:hypothetical protein